MEKMSVKINKQKAKRSNIRSLGGMAYSMAWIRWSDDEDLQSIAHVVAECVKTSGSRQSSSFTFFFIFLSALLCPIFTFVGVLSRSLWKPKTFSAQHVYHVCCVCFRYAGCFNAASLLHQARRCCTRVSRRKFQLSSTWRVDRQSSESWKSSAVPWPTTK